MPSREFHTFNFCVAKTWFWFLDLNLKKTLFFYTSIIPSQYTSITPSQTNITYTIPLFLLYIKCFFNNKQKFTRMCIFLGSLIFFFFTIQSPVITRNASERGKLERTAPSFHPESRKQERTVVFWWCCGTVVCVPKFWNGGVSSNLFFWYIFSGRWSASERIRAGKAGWSARCAWYQTWLLNSWLLLLL